MKESIVTAIAEELHSLKESICLMHQTSTHQKTRIRKTTIKKETQDDETIIAQKEVVSECDCYVIRSSIACGVLHLRYDSC